MKFFLGTIFIIAIITNPAFATPPPSFVVNSFTTGSQVAPDVAQAPSGDFVVVWQDDYQGDYSDIYFQRFSSSGTPVGGETLVNSYLTGNQTDPSICVVDNGDFVIAWEGQGSLDNSGIWMRQFSSSGSPFIAQLAIVNTFTTGQQIDPDVTCWGTSSFSVVWDGPSAADTDGGIVGRSGFFGSTIEGGSSEFQVNTITTGSGDIPAVAAGPNGFVVAWAGVAIDGWDSGEVNHRRYSSTGVPLDAFQVNTYMGLTSTYSIDVGIADSGSFVVAWNDNSVNYGNDIKGKVFDSGGTEQTSFHFQDAAGSGRNRTSTAFINNDGQFVVNWHNNTGPRINGRILNPDAGNATNTFELTDGTGYISELGNGPSTASNGNNGFVVVWAHYASGNTDIRAAIYSAEIFSDDFETGTTSQWSP